MATLSVTDDGKVRVWNTGSWEIEEILTSPEGQIWFSEDGKRLLVAGKDGTVRVWDFATWETLTTIRTTAEGASAAFSPDGELVAVGADNSVQVWDIAADQKLADFAAHRGGTDYVQFSPDGELLLTGGVDSTARVWRCETCGSLEELLALAKFHRPRESRGHDGVRSPAVVREEPKGFQDVLRVVLRSLDACVAWKPAACVHDYVNGKSSGW